MKKNPVRIVPDETIDSSRMELSDDEKKDLVNRLKGLGYL